MYLLFMVLHEKIISACTDWDNPIAPKNSAVHANFFIIMLQACINFVHYYNTV